MNLREDYEIESEQKPIRLAGNFPDNYAVGDLRYVEWLEETLETELAIRDTISSEKTKEYNRCIAFLKLNGYIEITEENSYPYMDFTYWTNENKQGNSGIDISKEEIVFISDEGDYLHIDCNYYALIGVLLRFNQLAIEEIKYA